MDTKPVVAYEQTNQTSRRLIRLPEVIRMTGVSRSTIYTLIALGKFPPGVKLGERIRAWLLSDIEGWIDERILAGDGS